MNVSDGMNYAPKGKPRPVVKPGEFVFSAVRLDHGHIYGMCNGLTEAGGTIKYVYDPDPKKVEAFLKAYPQAKAAQSLDQVLEDRETRMVCSSNVTSERGPLGVRVMQAGKDYFVDKAPFTTLEQLSAAKETVAQTGRKYMVSKSIVFFQCFFLRLRTGSFTGLLRGSMGRLKYSLQKSTKRTR